MNGGGGGESDRRADEADSERRLVAEMPYDWPNHPALNHRAKQPEAGKKIAGPRRVEAEPPRGKQGERGLEYREGEPVQEIDGEHAANDRAAHQLGQIAEWIAGPGVGAVHRLRQPEQRHGGRDKRDGRGRPDRRGVADMGQRAADGRAEDEAETERRANEAVSTRAILRPRDICDVRARGRDVPARQAVDDAGREQHADAVRRRQHDEADHGAGEAEHQNRTPAVAVGQIAQRRRGHQLAQREHRKEQSDDQRRRAECLGIKRQQRNDNSEPDQIDKDCKKDDGERTRHNGDNILYNQRTCDGRLSGGCGGARLSARQRW